MQYKYVQKCECCEDRVSIMRISQVGVRQKQELGALMTGELKRLGMKGGLMLACTEDLITAFNYTYANKAELKSSELVCESLVEVARKFAWKQVSEPATDYYHVEAA